MKMDGLDCSLGYLPYNPCNLSGACRIGLCGQQSQTSFRYRHELHCMGSPAEMLSSVAILHHLKPMITNALEDCCASIEGALLIKPISSAGPETNAYVTRPFHTKMWTPDPFKLQCFETLAGKGHGYHPDSTEKDNWGCVDRKIL